MLIIDGYNVLNQWQSARRFTPDTLSDAREKLCAKLADYAGYSDQKLILVFDAWQSERMARTEEKDGPLTVVYTRRGETADHYIERLCDTFAHAVEMGRVELRVATSDRVEQTVVMGRGAIRLSARELIFEMDKARSVGHAAMLARKVSRSTVMDAQRAEVREKLERMRRGEPGPEKK